MGPPRQAGEGAARGRIHRRLAPLPAQGGRRARSPSVSTSSTITTWARRTRRGPCRPGSAPASSSRAAWRCCGPTGSTSTSTWSRTSGSGGERARRVHITATSTPTASPAAAGSRRTPTDFHDRGVPEDPDVFDHATSVRRRPRPDQRQAARLLSSMACSTRADWMTRALDVQGFRLDDAKGVSTQFLQPLLDHGASRGKFAVGEFFDGNLGLGPELGRTTPAGWPAAPARSTSRCGSTSSRRCATTPASSTCRSSTTPASPAPTRSTRSPSSRTTTPTRKDASDRPEQAAGLRLDPDVRGLSLRLLQGLQHRPRLLRDEDDHRQPDLHPREDRRRPDAAAVQGPRRVRLRAHRRGPPARRPEQQRRRGPRRSPSTPASAPNAPLHDYTGHAGDVRTDGAGQATITIPKNTGGLGYVVLLAAGHRRRPSPRRASTSRRITKGAQDLDIKPADNTAFVPVCRVYVRRRPADPRRPYASTLRSWTTPPRSRSN